MNELTQEWSCIYASFVKRPLDIHQTARNMKRYMQEPALSNRSYMNQEETFSSQLQLSVARLNLVCCLL